MISDTITIGLAEYEAMRDRLSNAGHQPSPGDLVSITAEDTLSAVASVLEAVALAEHGIEVADDSEYGARGRARILDWCVDALKRQHDLLNAARERCLDTRDRARPVPIQPARMPRSPL